MLALTALWWGESRGLIVTPWSEQVRVQSLLSALVLLALNAAMLALLLATLSESLKRSRGQARALGASEARLRSLVQDAPVTIFGISPAGAIEFVNLEAVPAAPLMGRSIYELFQDAHREQARTAIRQTLEGGVMSSFEAEMGTGEGDRWWYSVHVGPVRVEDEIYGATLLCVDVSEVRQSRLQREAAMAELADRNDELQRFTYTVSHDLRSPLVTVKGFLGALETAAIKGQTDRVREDVARIRAAADRMDQLLRELLELSRVGRLVNPPQEALFADLVEEARGLVAGRLAQRGARLEVAPDLPLVWVDRLRLVEVLQNLLDNAAKFMGDQPEPRIEVGARRDGGETVFYVRDNGVGIDSRHHEKVFGLFERLDPTVDGTGIGLALVKRIVEVHRGRIWVESAGSGAGSSFCFTLGAPAGGAPSPVRPTETA
jgi:PAS domain S-box-containing protein